MKAHVVIGANFGDEGKGATTDYLASQYNDCIVVRFNGGCQAGHTVEWPDGKKHVFSHFGSGTLHNKPTYLSEHFVVNPLEFLDEQNKLIHVEPSLWNDLVHVHPDAKVTTPFDVMLNWASENKLRSKQANHGSCGFGIHETVKRHSFISLTVKDLQYPEIIKTTLQRILHEYIPSQVKQLDCANYIDDTMYSESTINNFLDDCATFMTCISIDEYEFLRGYQDVIFEGAQGLLLDEDHPWFPHVTHSKTGMHNVCEILEQFQDDVEIVNIHYITRPYLTRHGAGPLPGECPELKQMYSIVDKTNISNHFQQQLRFAPFNVTLFNDTVYKDIETAHSKLLWATIKPIVVVTCVNQLPDNVMVTRSDKMSYTTKDELLEDDIFELFTQMYVSSTPSVFEELKF